MAQKSQLITSIIFNGGNTLFLIYYIYDSILHPIDLLHITRQSFFLSSIFTTISLICDIIIYYSEKEENAIDMNYNLIEDKDNTNQENENYIIKIKKLDDWNKNKYGIVVNTFCFFVSLGFLCLYFFGNDIMLISKSIKNLFNCIYHHFIIQMIIIINIFISERKKQGFSWFYLAIIFSVYLSYGTFIYIEKYYFGINAYYFMRDKTKLFLFFCFLLSSLFLFICYLLNILIININNKLYTNNSGTKDEQNDINNNISIDEK